MAAVSWDGGGGNGNWMTPANWSGDALPTAADDVTIDVPGTASVTLAAAQSVRSLVSNETLTISGSLSVTDSCVLNGATTVTAQEASFVLAKNLTINGTLALHGGISFAGNADSMIDGTGSITAGNGNYTSRIRNATNNAGAGQKLTVGADIEIVIVHFNWTLDFAGGSNQLDGSLSSTGFLGLGSAEGSFVNNGLITTIGGSQPSSYFYNLINNPGKTINMGSLMELRGSLVSPSGFDNNGTITVSGRLVLVSSFTFADLGNVTGGGELCILGDLDLGGATLDLTGYPLNLSVGNASILSISTPTTGSIRNGTITGTASHRLISRSGTLDNITLDIPATLPALFLSVKNRLTLNKPVQILSEQGQFGFSYQGAIIATGANDVVIDGVGSITISGAGVQPAPLGRTILNRTRDPNTLLGKRLTIQSGISITGSDVNVGSTYSDGIVQLDGSLNLTNYFVINGFTLEGVINNGTISVKSSGTNSLSCVDVTNNGTFEVRSDTTLNATKFFNNGAFGAINSTINMIAGSVAGTASENNNVLNLDSSVLNLNSSTAVPLALLNSGTINSHSGIINLKNQAYVSNLGSISRSGADQLNLDFSLDLAGGTLTLPDAGGDWGVLGRFSNGTIGLNGAHSLASRNATFSGMVVNAPMKVAQMGGLTVENGLTLNSALTLGDASDNSFGIMQFVGNANQTLSGNGSILVAGTGFSFIQNNLRDQSTLNGYHLTIGPGIEITGSNLNFYSNYANGSITNNGSIGSTSPGGLFRINTQNTGRSFFNNGTLLASNGGETRVAGLYGNAGVLSPSGSGSVIDLDGNYAIYNDTTIGDDALLYLRGSWTKNATFDVGGGVVFDYAGASPPGTLYGQVITGYNSGAWDGSGIKSTRALASNLFALGMGEASSVLGNTGGNFMGRAVDSTAVLLRYTRKGDADLDADVDFDDLLRLSQNYGGNFKVWTTGDFNYDGSCNFDDLLKQAQNYGLSLLSSTRNVAAKSRIGELAI